MGSMPTCCIKMQKARGILVKRKRKKQVRTDMLKGVRDKMIISQIERAEDLDILDLSDFTTGERLGFGISSNVCLLVRKKDQQKFACKMIKSDVHTRDFL